MALPQFFPETLKSTVVLNAIEPQQYDNYSFRGSSDLVGLDSWKIILDTPWLANGSEFS